MKNIKSIILAIVVCAILIAPVAVLAAPPAMPGDGAPSGGVPGSSASSVSYNGATTISSDTTEDSKTYTSTTGSENALLVSGYSSTITNCTVTKSGDASGDEADFYGINAAVLAYNEALLNINNCNVTTNGSYANGVFSYGGANITIKDSTINTTSNNSGGIMVTGGGILTADNLTVKTTGNSSAAIRSDRGGGTITASGGTYETNGVGSPVIYSTADITVNDATLIATASEGVVVEGANSITLNNVTLTDTNNTLNGNSETYKNIFLYQSMSGDADTGTASFQANNSNITTNKGDTIFVTNTKATISLENNTITNTDGDFLRIQTGKWGSSGSNGGTVNLNMTNQKVSGNIIVDNVSTLDLTLTNGSVLNGAIDTDNQAKNITLTISSDSVLNLTADTYVASLTNDDASNANIYLNGHSLYVNGTKVSANDGTYDATTLDDNTSDTTNNSNDTDTNDNIIKYIGIGVAIVILVSGILLVLKKKENE